MDNTELVRTAAYLAEVARLDARRRTGKTGSVKCTPPNRQCGDRCIPPSWDCRLKGEGNDPHLAAVGRGSDPVAGFANIERSLKRFKKGALTLSFSEIEGGRRALARGAAKLTPGDIKKKEEVKNVVNNAFKFIGIPISVVLLAGLGHQGLKTFSGYRRGPGRQVDESVSNAFRSIKRNTPIWGDVVKKREARGRLAVASAERVARTQFSQSASLARIGSRSARITANDSIKASLSRVDRANGKGSRIPYSEWETQSLSAFWDAPRNKSIEIKGAEIGSVHSIAATNDLLSRTFGVTSRGKRLAGENLLADRRTVLNAIEKNLKITSSAIRQGMLEDGLDPKSGTDISAYVRRYRPTSNLDQATADEVERIISDTVLRSDHATQSQNLYARTLKGFDSYFKNTAAELTAKSYSPIYREGALAHARFLAADLGLVGPSAGRAARVSGPGTATVVRKIYHAKRVMDQRRPTIELSPTEVLTAATELNRGSGRPSPQTVQDGLAILNSTYVDRKGINVKAFTVSGPTPRPPSTPSPVEAPETTRNARRRRFQFRSIQEVETFADIVSRELANGATQAQAESRARYEVSRQRTDATDLPPERVQAYLWTRYEQLLSHRLDFTQKGERSGKPCGRSFVPKEAKCSKPVEGGYADQPQTKASSNNIVKTAGALAAGAGVVAAGVAAYRNRRAISTGFKIARNTIKAERQVYNEIKNKKLGERNSYGGRKYSKSGAENAARREYIESRKAALREVHKRYTPQLMNAGIARLSQDDVTQAIGKLPKQFQQSASQLLGKAKAGLAFVSADANGYKVRKVDAKNNFSLLSTDDGERVLSIGSVGDTLVMFNADKRGKIDLKTESGRGVGIYDVQFTTDLGFKQKKNVNKSDQAAIAGMLKSMNKDTTSSLPKNAVLRNIPFKDDGLGTKRAAIYKRFGYKKISGIRGEAMFATLSNGKVVPIAPEYEDFYADLIKGDDYDTATQKFMQRNRRDSSGEDQVSRLQAYLLTKQALGILSP